MRNRDIYENFYISRFDTEWSLVFSGIEGLISGADTLTLGNSSIVYESAELTESLCSQEQLMFGSCEASMFRCDLCGLEGYSFKDKWVDLFVISDHDTTNPVHIGHFKVYSDTLDKANGIHSIEAYDAMHDLLDRDVTPWWSGFERSISITLKNLRNSLFSYMNFPQADANLVNDSFIVQPRNIFENYGKITHLTFRDIITQICSLNGVFGHINADREFQYVSLRSSREALYPSETLYPKETLYPRDEDAVVINKRLLKAGDYEDFLYSRVDKLSFLREDEVEIATRGNGSNLYTLKNWLLYGSSEANCQVACDLLYMKIRDIDLYRPCDLDLVGNPCIEVGDPFIVYCYDRVVRSYVLQRRLVGCQALFDNYEAKGTSQYEDISTPLSRRVEMASADARTRIEQTDTKITLEAERATEAEGQLLSRITQTASEISSEVTRATQEEGRLSSLISQKADSISLGVTRDGDTKANITITLKNAEGETIDTATGVIEILGQVTFTDLATAGSTVINGDNITTGTISADRVKISELYTSTAYGGVLALHGSGSYGNESLIVDVENFTAQSIGCDNVGADELSARVSLYLQGKEVELKTVNDAAREGYKVLCVAP